MHGTQKPWPRAVLFDLDGTLVDSAPDLHAAANIMLARHDLGPLSLDQVTSMIGNGVRKLVERAFAAVDRPLDEAGLDAEHAAMMGIYGDHLTVLTTLMPGTRTALDGLAGIGLGVVTNKPQAPTEAILAHFGLAPLFGAVIGGDTGIERKPAPDMLLAAAARLGATASDTLMVGDSPADVESGRAAGMAVVAVRGGYTTIPVDQLGADLVIDSLAGLAGAIDALRQTMRADDGRRKIV